MTEVADATVTSSIGHRMMCWCNHGHETGVLQIGLISRSGRGTIVRVVISKKDGNAQHWSSIWKVGDASDDEPTCDTQEDILRAAQQLEVCIADVGFFVSGMIGVMDYGRRKISAQGGRDLVRLWIQRWRYDVDSVLFLGEDGYE